MKLNIIAAIGKNNELGLNNKLIWHLKGDMKFFKEKTMYHTIIMGKNTFDSLPKILPNRNHLVLTHQNISIQNVQILHSIKEFLDKYQCSNEEIYNIGGASLYKELLDYTDNLYLTEIDATAKADAYFPKFNKNDFEKIILDEKEEKNIKYKHVLYKRRQKYERKTNNH